MKYILMRFVTGCQDIDDALHAKMLENGNIEAGVRKSSCHQSAPTFSLSLA
jgi:hypothetical protein